MKPTTPTLRTIFFYAILFYIALNLVSTASAADVNIDSISVNVNPSEIKPGEDFTVSVTLNEPEDSDTVDVRVKIVIDGVVVHNKTHNDIDLHVGNDTTIDIDSGDFRVGNDNVWNENLMNYECGDNLDVEVTVSGGVNTESDSDTLTIAPDGDEGEHTLDFSIDPDNPQVDEDITIAVKNDDGDGVKSARVKFTWIDDNKEDKWEVDDPSEEAPNTDSDGETIFNIADDFREEYGKYQIDAYKSNYCKATQFLTITKGELTIGNPEPANPKVGEQFKIKVTDGTNPIKGAKAVINELGVHLTSTSDTDGYLKFTINTAGTFTIFINVSGYGQVEKMVTVSNLNPLTVSISPAPAETNKAVTIVVYSNGNPVSSVSLTITKPEGGKDVKTTGSDGKATYTPEKVGSYTVIAAKDGYQNTSESFTVNSAFEIQTPPAGSIVYGSDLTITVVDAGTKVPVSNALVSGTGVAYGAKTNSMGQYTTKLGSSGQYNFLVSKDGYTDKGVSVMALCKVNLVINTTSAEVGQPIRIRVFDKEKNDYVSGNIAISKPDGTSDSKAESDYILNTTLIGTYVITLSKANCVGGEVSMEVKTRQLRLESELKDNKIIVKTVSNGKTVSGVEVNITSPSGLTQLATSDESGLITINAIENGNYTITTVDPKYSESTTSIEKQPSFLSKYWWAILIAAIAVLIGILLLLAVILFMRSRKGEDTSFRKGGGSSLGG